MQVVEFHVALPSLENHFDTPAQTVEGKQGGEVGLLWGDGGDQDGPVHQGEDRLGRIVTVGLFPGLHAPEIGGFLVDGSTDQTDGRAELVVEEHGDVEVSVFAQHSDKVDGLPAVGIKVNGAGFVAVDAVGTRIAVPLDFVGDEVAAITEDQVARLKGKFRSRREVVFGIGVDGKVDQAKSKQVVGDLNPCVADLGMGVGDPGKFLK